MYYIKYIINCYKYLIDKNHLYNEKYLKKINEFNKNKIEQ